MVSRCIYISLCRHSCEIRLDHNFEKFANYLGQELVSVRSEWRKYKHPQFALGQVLRRSAVLSPVIHHRPHLNIPCYPEAYVTYITLPGHPSLISPREHRLYVVSMLLPRFGSSQKKLRSNPAVISLKHPLLFPSTTTRLAYIGCCFFGRSNERNKCLLLASFEVVFDTQNRAV